MFTIGVEEEFHVIDPATGALAPDAGRVLEGDSSNSVEPELQQSVVETGSAVCETLADVRRELLNSRRKASAAAESAGRRIAASGTHPFSDWQEIDIAPEAAYLRVERDYQQLAREQMVCGCHVHIGIDDQNQAIEVMNRARSWLPTLLAVSSNSPFWLGAETGYCSFRNRLWQRWPISGIPGTFASRADYDALVQRLLTSGALDDPARLYWDVRPSAKFDTLEFRVADVCMSVDDAVLLAALTRALSQTCYEQALAGVTAPNFRPELLRVAMWRAARFGDNEDLLDPTGSPRKTVPRFIDFVKPVLQTRGEWEEVSALLDEWTGRGSGAARQIEAYRRSRSLQEVVNVIVSNTAREL